jgi:hypothetical protein
MYLIFMGAFGTKFITLNYKGLTIQKLYLWSFPKMYPKEMGQTHT